MVDFLCTLPCSRIDLTVAMETMDFFILQLSLSLRTKIFCISGVPMNDLAPMKNCPGGCKVGQISSRGNTDVYWTTILHTWKIRWKLQVADCKINTLLITL